jgi:phosphoserine phosphatase RsbX
MGTLNMESRRADPSPLLEWGFASVALRGETMSGDLHLVQPFADGGGVLVGAVDGLGHGEEAAAAARRAVETLQTFAHESVIALIRRCHEALHRTRGVVMSLASFQRRDDTMTWLGVGNVEGMLLRADPAAARETILLRGGVVGYELPQLRGTVVPITPGDTLLFATDGIRAGFDVGLNPADPPQRLADQILARCTTGTDDALVLVARYKKE